MTAGWNVAVLLRNHAIRASEQQACHTGFAAVFREFLVLSACLLSSLPIIQTASVLTNGQDCVVGLGTGSRTASERCTGRDSTCGFMRQSLLPGRYSGDWPAAGPQRSSSTDKPCGPVRCAVSVCSHCRGMRAGCSPVAPVDVPVASSPELLMSWTLLSAIGLGALFLLYAWLLVPPMDCQTD